MASAPNTEKTGEEREILFAELDIPEMAARILTAAMRLFARKGYSATSVREIVQEARVTNPMLYYYFDSKEGVFRKLIEILSDVSGAGMTEIIQREDLTVQRKVTLIWHQHLEAAREVPEALRFVYSVLFGPSEGRPAHELFERRMELMGIVDDMFAQAIASGELRVREGITPTFLTTYMFSSINQHMMLMLKIAEEQSADIVERFCMEELHTIEAVERFVGFFFLGACGAPCGADAQASALPETPETPET